MKAIRLLCENTLFLLYAKEADPNYFETASFY